MSIPPFIEPPSGVGPVSLATGRGTFAALDNDAALTAPPVGSVVLVPGFTGSKEDFISLLVPLALRGARSVAFDLTGQFETPGPPDADRYSLAGFAADVWAVAATLPRPLVLAGHSFGGLVVREAVLSDPLAADGLAIIASGPAALPDDQQSVLRMFVDIMNRLGLEAVLQGKRAMDAAAGIQQPSPDIDAFLNRRFLSNSPGSLQVMIETLCGVTDQVEALASVAPPTAVVIGGRDDVWPTDQQREMADRLRAKVTALPAAGHSPAIDDPDAVADTIAELFG